MLIICFCMINLIKPVDKKMSNPEPIKSYSSNTPPKQATVSIKQHSVPHKRNKKPQPVIKGACIGDPSSSDEEQLEKRPQIITPLKNPVVIGEDDSEYQESKKFTVSHQQKKEDKVVIGDESDEEDSQNQNIDKTKEKHILEVAQKETNAGYEDKLAQIYADKKVRNELKLKEREERLKKYEEERKTKNFKKLADSDDSEDEHQEIGNNNSYLSNFIIL
jgi:hypothetical protein